MTKGNLTREQAIKSAGIAAVEKVDAENCQPTNRVGYNGACQSNDLCEWSASIRLDDGRCLTAYYYINNEQEQAMADADGDGSAINWEIAGYEID